MLDQAFVYDMTSTRSFGANDSRSFSNNDFHLIVDDRRSGGSSANAAYHELSNERRPKLSSCQGTPLQVHARPQHSITFTPPPSFEQTLSCGACV